MSKVKRITYKFRVYPTVQQIAYLRDHWRTLRWLWNTVLRMRLNAWERVVELYRRAEYTDDETRKAEHLAEAKWYCQEFESQWAPGNLGYQRQLAEARALWPELASRSSDSENMLLRDLDAAWQRWRDAVKRARGGSKEAEIGPPRFKPRHAPVSLATSSGERVRFSGEGFTFPGVPKDLGPFKVVRHRPAPGVVKQARLIEDSCREWYVTLSCEVPDAVTPETPDAAVGIDRGVVNLAADSTGNVYPSPRPLTPSEEHTIKHIQRRCARLKKGSRRWRELMLRKAHIEARVSRRRDHLLHAVANHYTENFSTIVIEALALKNMTKSAAGTLEEPGSQVRQKAGLNRAILGAAPGRLAEFIRYKAAWRESKVVEVNAAFTSQTCSACGHVSADSRRSQSEFLCVACGHAENADTNAARNILARGMAGEVKAKRATVKTKTVKGKKKAA